MTRSHFGPKILRTRRKEKKKPHKPNIQPYTPRFKYKMQNARARVLELLSTDPLDPTGPSFEETEHAWANSPEPIYTIPFLKVWDENSGSRPDDSNRLQARLSQQALGSRQSREEALTTHAEKWEWDPTPFISFNSSVAGLRQFQLLARSWSPFPAWLTVINPNVRIARGLPMIKMDEEMRYYQVDPDWGDYSLYRDEYLCLWEVTPEEVVGHWEWNELINDANWYEDLILPAFNAHNEGFLRGNEMNFDMSPLRRALPCSELGYSTN
jgi:hypothetical protein